GDLNGDGRDDIVARDEERNRYYLQAADGTFPAEPSFTLALEDFRDPADAAKPSGVLEMLDDLRFTADSIDETDLDGDGIRDYVVLTSSRVLAFRGTRDGVNASDPWQILRFGAAVGNVLLFDVNGDGRKDLVAARIDVPPLPRLLVGLFAGFTVDIRALAFFAGPDGRFSRKPDRSNTLHLEVPPIVDILRHPDAYKKKFERLKGIRWRPDEIAEVDLDGDGRAEALVFDEAGVTVRAPAAPIGARRTPERIGRARVDPGGIAAIADAFVFNPDRATYTVDTLAPAIEELARVLRTSGEARRAAADAAPLVAAGPLRIRPRSVEVRDVDGDGRPDVILRDGGRATVLWNRKP
ncbi:MAG TPA: VCBS repeat-containing protein, partial [Planctomycetota bacterium]|nr:VCBS repeat-containing protein [Planctomycetota bacterium]